MYVALRVQFVDRSTLVALVHSDVTTVRFLLDYLIFWARLWKTEQVEVLSRGKRVLIIYYSGLGPQALCSTGCG